MVEVPRSQIPGRRHRSHSRTRSVPLNIPEDTVLPRYNTLQDNPKTYTRQTSDNVLHRTHSLRNSDGSRKYRPERKSMSYIDEPESGQWKPPVPKKKEEMYQSASEKLAAVLTKLEENLEKKDSEVGIPNEWLYGHSAPRKPKKKSIIEQIKKEENEKVSELSQKTINMYEKTLGNYQRSLGIDEQTPSPSSESFRESLKEKKKKKKLDKLETTVDTLTSLVDIISPETRVVKIKKMKEKTPEVKEQEDVWVKRDPNAEEYITTKQKLKQVEAKPDEKEKNKFLKNLEKKIDKLRTNDKKYVNKAIRSLRESSLGPAQDIVSENVLIKRAVSLNDCRQPGRIKSTVNSVLGMFKKFENDKKWNNKTEKISKQNNNDDNMAAKGNNVVLDKMNAKGNNVVLDKTNAKGNNVELDNVKNVNETNMSAKGKFVGLDNVASSSKSDLVIKGVEFGVKGNGLEAAGDLNMKKKSFIDDKRNLPVFEFNNVEDEPKRRPSFNFDDSSSFLSPDSESFDSWSNCSDFGNIEDINVKPLSPILRHINLDDVTESVGDRIRRKSFYSRFNERKKHRKSAILDGRRSDEDHEHYRQPYLRKLSQNLDPVVPKPQQHSYSRSLSSTDYSKLAGDTRPRPFYKSTLQSSSSPNFTLTRRTSNLTRPELDSLRPFSPIRTFSPTYNYRLSPNSDYYD